MCTLKLKHGNIQLSIQIRNDMKKYHYLYLYLDIKLKNMMYEVNVEQFNNRDISNTFEGQRTVLNDKNKIKGL